MNISVGSFSPLSTAATDKMREIKTHSATVTATPDISNLESGKLKELTGLHDIAVKSSKYLIVAKDLHSKFEKAVDVMAEMQATLTNATALINGYNGTKEQLPLLQSVIDQALHSIADGLSSSYEGGFVFGGSGLEHLKPVTKNFIEHFGNLAADGTKTDNYVVYRSMPSNKEISEGVKVNASLNPGDESFINLISGLHAIKAQLGALNPNDPMPGALNAAAVTNVNNGSRGLSLLVQNAANMRDKAANAMEKAEENAAEAKDRIKEALEIDPLEFSTKLKGMEQALSVLMSIIASSMQRSAQMIEALSRI